MSTRYKILKDLGRGAMGEVVLAMDTKLSRKVALKFLSTQVESDREYVDRIMREARIAADLNHPNIVHIYDFGEFKDTVKTGGYDGRTYISMEFIEGKSLKALLKESARLENKVILKVALQIAEALAYAHRRNIFHRDIKPENILITSEDQVKLLDFGLAKSASVSTMTKEQVLGTPYYMSPEQADGDHNIDYRTDIFSFGIVLYELITHERPFHGDTFDVVKHSIQTKEPTPVAELNADASRGFQKIIDKCIAKKREERYQSATEIIKSLRREERLIEPFDGLTVRMDDPSPKDWKESLVNEAKTLRKHKETEEVKRLLSTGQRRYSRGKYEAAVESFKEVIAINPEHPEANEYLEKIRKTMEHTEIIEKCIVDGEFYLNKKKYEEATELFERALKIDPHNKTAKKGLQRGERGLGIRSGTSFSWVLPRALLVVAGLVIAWFVASNLDSLKSTSSSDKPEVPQISEDEGGEAVTPNLGGLTPEIRAKKEAAIAARDRMRTEKEAAEKLQAAYYADELFKLALARELRAERLLASSEMADLTTSEQQFKDATELFSKAIADAQERQKQQVENVKARGDAESEKRQMLANKNNVPASSRSSNATYRQGERSEITGDAQFKKGEFISALSSYRQASSSYSKAKDEAEAATRRTSQIETQERAERERAAIERAEREQEARERDAANSAQQLFLTKTQQIGETNWQNSAEFAEVNDLSLKATDAYNKGRFPQASKFYSEAVTAINDVILAREKQRQALLDIREQDNQAIESIVSNFKQSLERGDFASFRKILPLDQGEIAVWSRFFQEAKKIKADIGNTPPSISGDNASVKVQGTLNYYNSDRDENEVRKFNETWLLNKVAGNWKIVSTQ